MRLSQPPTLLCLLFTILSTTHTSSARPQDARDQELFEAQYRYLDKRACAGTVCGWNGQLCCTGGQTCSTNSAGQAECVAGLSGGSQQLNANANGQWQVYVTTYVESELTTVTSTYSSFLGGNTAAPAATAAQCDISMNESPCGSICCAVGQYCAVAGQCAASNGQGGSSSYFASITTAQSTATAFIRPTSNAATTVTSTGSATTTVPFQTPSASASGAGGAAGMTSTTSNNGLSGGAIAGIVIGVIAAILLLLLLFFCFCVRGILGFGGRRRRKNTTYIEERERRRHHGATSGVAAGGGRTWFGTRPARVDRPKKKKSSGIGGLTWVAGALAALAICLGLRRRKTERREKSDYSASSYGYTDSYISESSESTYDSRDRRTTRTGRTDTRRSAR